MAVTKCMRLPLPPPRCHAAAMPLPSIRYAAVSLHTPPMSADYRQRHATMLHAAICAARALFERQYFATMTPAGQGCCRHTTIAYAAALRARHSVELRAAAPYSAAAIRRATRYFSAPPMLRREATPPPRLLPPPKERMRVDCVASRVRPYVPQAHSHTPVTPRDSGCR